METRQPETAPYILTFNKLGIIAIFFQIYGLRILWRHNSVTQEFLGRFSYRYGIGLVVAMAISALWILMFLFFRKPFQRLIERIPVYLVYVVLALSGTGLLWLFRQQFAWYWMSFMATNWMLMSVAVIAAQPDRPAHINRWVAFIIIALLVMYASLFLSFMSWREYTPDEAHWADYTNTIIVEGRLYSRAAFQIPTKIHPGLGWFVSVYGWFLDHVAFDIRVGRIFNQSMYLLSIGGIGLVTSRLYNKNTAFVTVAIVIMSASFFRKADFRLDHFVAFGQTLTFFAVISARQATTTLRRQMIWDYIAGLLIALTMLIHLSAVTFGIGLTIFYTAYLIFKTIQNRGVDSSALAAFVLFGLGGLTGMAIYYVANIAPNGGIIPFLDILTSERGNSTREFRYMYYWWWPERALMYGGFAYLLWRRNQSDKLYLALTACSIIGIFVADTQGYVQPYLGWLWVPAAVWLVDGIRLAGVPAGTNRNSLAILCCVLLALAAHNMHLINTASIRYTLENGKLPPHPVMDFSRQVIQRVPIEEGEVVIATLELIWSMPDYVEFYAPMAEGSAENQRGWVGTQVWEYLQPDLYIQINGRMVTSPGLQDYIEQENFVICDEFNVHSYDVRVLRRSCEMYEESS